MKFNPVLPYPVLSKENDSYYDSDFDVQVIAKKSFGQLVLEAEFVLDNPSLQDLINQGKAVFVLHYECSHTSFRGMAKSNQETLTIQLDEQQVRGKIDVHSFILANERIVDYINPNWNSFYAGFPITYEKGNSLAFGGAAEIVLHEEAAEEQKLPSIVTIRRASNRELVGIELGADQILVLLPEKLYKQYANYGGSRLKDTILSLIILPALIDVFHTIKVEPSSFEDNRWYKVLVQIFENNNVQFDRVLNDQIPVIEAAQLVLRNPLVASFKEMGKFLVQGED
ncbi:hypothetical protein P4256_15100 [Bacillus wiedmannii]|uniref:hypothetical protein n=1 Tax=Bacillus cereus group TaxID=86661 RepID=UPI000994FD53|nr:MULTISPECIES: hypothetical protein [Bacillus cereus group]MED2793056.1 hypothetical protein [Bacillus wiedmannii]OPA18140.1 hypothetical protein BHL54_03160 [Bacillus cereus]